MSTVVTGRCLCGSVTFTVAPPYRWFAHCHCSMCRKHHGALFGTGLGVARERLEWRYGNDDIVHYRATAAFERPYCRHCGSTVPGVSHDSAVFHVPAGLLDAHLDARPRTHIFTSSKSSLVTIDDALPQFVAYPPGIPVTAVTSREPPRSARGVAGSCLCGAVAFETDERPRRLVNCYCSLCRRSRGAAFSSTLFVAAAAFHWLRGPDTVKSYALPAPRQYRVDFCADCGSLVPTVLPGAPAVFLPAGALDAEPGPLPIVHTYVGSRAAWHDITDPWPQFDELPPPERFAEFFG